MKVFLLRPHENWIIDRVIDEWESAHSRDVTSDPTNADVLWLTAGWCWNHIHPELLMRKRVIASVYHIVPEKLDMNSWRMRDQFVDAYHTICEKSAEQIRRLTKKPVYSIPFWVNSEIWFPIDQLAARAIVGLDSEMKLFGSFQRDTEGSDGKSPKLEKGPDIFCEILEDRKRKGDEFEVVLAGWRRQYVMNRLSEAGIKFKYFERTSQEMLNTLYNTLDLYIVTSRIEGGPQALVECAMTETPIVSTDVGIARDVLPDKSIISFANPCESFDDVEPDVEHARKRVDNLVIPHGFTQYNEMFEEVSR